MGDGEELLYMLKMAMEHIGNEYFSIQEAGTSQIKTKERVYCYELYHQLRTLMDERNCPYNLFGEPTKQGHLLVRNGYSPDFIIHKPGCMTHNLIAVEVKRAKSSNQSIINDGKKLADMLRDNSYFIGIMIIFGQTRNSRVKEIWNQVCIQNQEESARIVLLWHKEQGKVEEKNHLM